MRACLLLSALVFALKAYAGAVSYTGTFATPEDTLEETFILASTSNVQIAAWGIRWRHERRRNGDFIRRLRPVGRPFWWQRSHGNHPHRRFGRCAGGFGYAVESTFFFRQKPGSSVVISSGGGVPANFSCGGTVSGHLVNAPI